MERLGLEILGRKEKKRKIREKGREKGGEKARNLSQKINTL